jgi:hypothetical protein
MFSMPPAMAASSEPIRISCAADTIACAPWRAAIHEAGHLLTEIVLFGHEADGIDAELEEFSMDNEAEGKGARQRAISRRAIPAVRYVRDPLPSARLLT